MDALFWMRTVHVHTPLMEIIVSIWQLFFTKLTTMEKMIMSSVRRLSGLPAFYYGGFQGLQKNVL